MKLFLLSAVALLCLQLTIAAPTDGESEENETEQNKTEIIQATEEDTFIYAVLSLLYVDDKNISKIELKLAKDRVEETKTALKEQFKLMDKNGNGIIEIDEFALAMNLGSSLLNAIISNCDTDNDGKTSINDLKNAEVTIEDMGKEVDKLMVEGVKLNKTEFHNMKGKFTDKEQTVLKFAASTIGGNDAADLSISKDDMMKAINKVIHILKTLRANFTEVDKNNNGVIERIEIIRKLVEMNEAVDTDLLSSVTCYCDEIKQNEKLTQDKLGEILTKFNDMLNKVDFEKADTNGDGELDINELKTIFPEWVWSAENEKN